MSVTGSSAHRWKAVHLLKAARRLSGACLVPVVSEMEYLNCLAVAQLHCSVSDVFRFLCVGLQMVGADLRFSR